MPISIVMIKPIPTQFGDPTPEHLRLMNDIPSRFRGALSGISVPPPSQDDETLRREMKTLLRHVASPELDPEFCESVDQDMTPAIMQFAQRNGVEAATDEIDDLMDDLKPVIMRLKYKFNTPRPWQVSPSLGTNLRRFVSLSSQTPSYPSGHAIQAAAACTLLGERHPSAARELDRFARSIGLSRLELGVHFPMDVFAGLKLGREIGRRIA